VLGPAGLSPAETPMFMGAPRSYRALKASAMDPYGLFSNRA